MLRDNREDSNKITYLLQITQINFVIGFTPLDKHAIIAVCTTVPNNFLPKQPSKLFSLVLLQTRSAYPTGCFLGYKAP